MDAVRFVTFRHDFIKEFVEQIQKTEEVNQTFCTMYILMRLNSFEDEKRRQVN